jgi:hypothetical protein
VRLFCLAVNEFSSSNSTEIRVFDHAAGRETTAQAMSMQDFQDRSAIDETVAIKAQPVSTRDTGSASVTVKLKG